MSEERHEFCPKCGDALIENETMCYDDTTMEMGYICNDCGYRWIEIWQFVHNEEVGYD